MKFRLLLFLSILIMLGSGCQFYVVSRSNADFKIQKQAVDTEGRGYIYERPMEKRELERDCEDDEDDDEYQDIRKRKRKRKRQIEEREEEDEYRGVVKRKKRKKQVEELPKNNSSQLAEPPHLPEEPKKKITEVNDGDVFTMIPVRIVKKKKEPVPDSAEDQSVDYNKQSEK